MWRELARVTRRFFLLLFDPPKKGLNLGVRTCYTHGWRKQRKQRSKHNRTQKNKRCKTKKKFTGSYTEVNPKKASAPAG